MLPQYNLRGAIHVCVVKRIPFALVFAILLLAFPAFANERGVKRVETYATADRHALVIGNSAYTQTSPLRNPVNDAKSMTSSLQALGFTVTTLTDSNQRAMDQAIRKFGKILRNQGGVSPPAPPEAEVYLVIPPREKNHNRQTLEPQALLLPCSSCGILWPHTSFQSQEAR